MAGVHDGAAKPERMMADDQRWEVASRAQALGRSCKELGSDNNPLSELRSSDDGKPGERKSFGASARLTRVRINRLEFSRPT
jgi:hypothetical protein